MAAGRDGAPPAKKKSKKDSATLPELIVQCALSQIEEESRLRGAFTESVQGMFAGPLDAKEVKRLLACRGPPGSVRFEGDVRHLRVLAWPIMASTQSLPEGTLLRDYRLGRCLGSGAMGEVYAARDERTGMKVAIKVLRPEVDEALHAAQRLLEEAHAVSAIRHPGVVQVLDVGLLDERPWLAMELLEGQTLKDRLKTGPMLMEEAFGVLSGVLSTIVAAHRAGVVHRDLKPANIFLVTTPAEVKVLDFGVALREGRTSFRTAPTRAVGSMGFMAPEQLMGEAVPASDLYAIGCLAYLIFTGRPVFPMTNIPDLARQHLSQPPPKLRVHRPGLPEALEAWIDGLLSKSAADRPPSDAALVELRALMPRSGRVTEVVEAYVPVTEIARQAVATRASSAALRPLRETPLEDSGETKLED